jgi:hypothetical protein
MGASSANLAAWANATMPKIAAATLQKAWLDIVSSPISMEQAFAA